MPSSNDLMETDLVGLAALVAAKDLTPSELAETAQARIDVVNPLINAVIRPIDPAQDLANLADLSATPLSGVPFLIKDLTINYAGLPTSAASPLLIDKPVPHDSELMARYRKSGLITLGKTNTCEFGTLGTTEPKLFGPTRNPWDTTRSSGGSSGGSAAAVAARMVPAAHANDGAGSIRIPASCCGVFGLKPSKGRITHGPDFGEGSVAGIGVEHAVTLSVRDSAALLDVTAGGMPGDPYYAPVQRSSFTEQMRVRPRALRVACADVSMFGTPVNPSCKEAVHEAARLLEDLGHQVEFDAPDFSFAEYEEVYRRFWTLTATRTLSLLSQRTGIAIDSAVERSEPFNRYLFEKGIRITAAQYLKDIVFFNGFARRVAEFHSRYDLWLTPTLASPAPLLGHFDAGVHGGDAVMDRFIEFLAFTTFANMTGQPAMSVPLHWNAEGLPVGTQFTARYGEEGLLFNLARQLEEAKPWADRKPDLKS